MQQGVQICPDKTGCCPFSQQCRAEENRQKCQRGDGSPQDDTPVGIQRHGRQPPASGDGHSDEQQNVEKPAAVGNQGRAVQDNFMKDLLRGMDEATQAAFFSAITIIDRNMDELLKEMK